jgi:hypothetical protein
MLLPERDDKWWEINAGTDIDRMITEVRGCLMQEVVPFLGRFKRPQDLVTLWTFGKAPGLTDKQRLSYLRDPGASRAAS